MQVKLLRVLQEREIRRVGENQSRPVDVRIIAATNRDLGQQVAAGTFRQDLYYRIKVVELQVPPLRERKADILPLAREMLASSAVSMNRKVPGWTPEVADQLLAYDWPGNARELENAMERAAALAEDRVELEDLPEEIQRGWSSLDPTPETVRPLEAVEKEYILTVLALNRGNQAQAARQLEIGTATLYRKLREYGLTGATCRQGSLAEMAPA